MKRSTPARTLGLLALVGVVLWIGRAFEGGNVEDPEVLGRRVSFWFREICRSTAVPGFEGTESVNDPRAWAAMRALRSAGTNAIPWIVGQALKPPTRWERWVEPLRRRPWLRDRVSWPWPLSAEDRQSAARGVLQRWGVPAAGLLGLVEPALRSPDPGERLLAIRCLGAAGAGRELAVSRLRPFLGSTNAVESFEAVRSVGRLGGAAVLAAKELMGMPEATKPVDMALATALGNCGSAAVPVLGVLEARWGRGIEARERLWLAVAMLRIQPEHVGARRFLEEGFSKPGGGDTMFRGLGNLLWEEGIHEPVFVPWLLRGFDERGSRGWPAGGYTALAVLAKTAPVEVAKILREGIRVASSPAEAVAVAGYWVELQPDSAEAAEVLLAAARADDSVALAAVSRIWLADPLPAGALVEIRRFLEDPRVPEDLRHQLGQVQRALGMRANGRLERKVP